MPFERAQPSIVRSIRHISLFKDWTRARRTHVLPHFSDFVPDARAGDSADLLIAEARMENGEIRLYCRSAGARVEQIFDAPISNRYLRDTVDAKLANAARQVWHGCLTCGMPLFSVISLADCDGYPVTIEQIYLPYRSKGQHADVIVSAIHAWSTEGRFTIRGLIRNLTTASSHQTVIVDATLAMSVAIDRSDVIEGR